MMNSLAADGCIQKHAQTAQLVDDTYNEQYIFDVVNDLRDKSLYRWSDNPRLFLIFRDIGQIREPDKPQLLDDFIKSGISDIWLPIASHELLQEVLPPGLHDQFLKAQRRVCSQPTQLQAGLGNLHRNFATKDGAPFKQRRSIGRGRLGHVEEVQGASDGRLYARKSIRKSSYINTARNDILRFYCELKTLHRINHRHCVQIVGSYTNPLYLAIVMLPVADFDLKEFLELAQTSSDIYHTFRIREWFGCLAAAVHYLHGNRIRHRDIKPANILVKGFNILLVDFELALDWKDLDQSTTTAYCGRTPLYAAPEVIKLQKCNSTSDIWSLGCVFLEMVTVLKGKPIDELREHFISQTESKCFFNNLRGIHSWISILAAVSNADNAPLMWISKMLQAKRILRLKIGAVVDLIRSSNYGNGSNPYFGSCCQAPLCTRCGNQLLNVASSVVAETALSCAGDCHTRIYRAPSSSSIIPVQPLMFYFHPSFLVQHLTQGSMEEFTRSVVAQDIWENQECSVQLCCLPKRPINLSVTRFLPAHHLYSFHKKNASTKIDIRYSMPLGIRRPNTRALAETFEEYLDALIGNHLIDYGAFMAKRGNYSSKILAVLCEWFDTWKERLPVHALLLMKSAIKAIMAQTIIGRSLNIEEVPEAYKQGYFGGYSGPQVPSSKGQSPRLVNRQVKTIFFILYQLHLEEVLEGFNELIFTSKEGSRTAALFISICLAFLMETVEDASQSFLLFTQLHMTGKIAVGSKSDILDCYRELNRVVFDRIYRVLSVSVKGKEKMDTLMATDLSTALRQLPRDQHSSRLVPALLDFVFRN